MDTLNLIKQKVRNSLELIGTGDNFVNRTPMSQALRSTVDKWDFMKLNSFCKAKDIVSTTKEQPIDWERFFTNLTSDRGIISKIYEALKKLDTNNPNNLIRMGYRAKQRILNRGILSGQESLKEMFNILSHQGKANQIDPEIHLTLIRMAKIENSGDDTLMRMWRKRKTLLLLVGLQISTTTLEINLEVPQKTENRST